jgi:hypothetical protein
MSDPSESVTGIVKNVVSGVDIADEYSRDLNFEVNYSIKDEGESPADYIRVYYKVPGEDDYTKYLDGSGSSHLATPSGAIDLPLV